MRIISQDGKIDLPYEQCAMQIMKEYKNVSGRMQINGYSIRAYLQTDHGTFRMADYTTEEKAKKTMEMLQNTYYQNKYQETYKDTNHEFVVTFQFPQDDEVA